MTTELSCYDKFFSLILTQIVTDISTAIVLINQYNI